MLGTGVVSCNHGEGLRNGLHKDASRSDQLVHVFGNLPRTFAIGKLKKLEIVPEISEQAGKVAGIMTEDRGIASIDEEVIKQLSRPVIQQHVEQSMSAYRDFQIAATDFLLFKEGGCCWPFPLFQEATQRLEKFI
jgi:hypothetical protein